MWDKVKSMIASAAPLVGGLIGGPVGGSVGALVAHTLGVENTPEAIEAELKSNPDALLKIKQMESDERIRLRELAYQHAELESAERKLALTEQHKLMKAELDSEDSYVRRWRPTFGYAVCAAWTSLFFGIALLMLIHPEHTEAAFTGAAKLTGLFSVALTVLGLNIHKRSQDKQVSSGVIPAGVLGSVASKLRGGADVR
ncbi:3TM-type holin [Vibrio sp. TBV020]|uniref:3TM-type holin n=1 Tax=Vibrio sp. TBV020 TaxID=3137398 RepID=UPI0038CD6CC4